MAIFTSVGVDVGIWLNKVFENQTVIVSIKDQAVFVSTYKNKTGHEDQDKSNTTRISPRKTTTDSGSIDEYKKNKVYKT